MRKRIVSLLVTAAFSFTAMSFTAWGAEDASSDDKGSMLQRIYENFVKEGSGFDEYRQMMGQYYEDVAVTDKLEDDRIIITIDSTNEYVPGGTWEFIQDGDYLTCRIGAEDYFGSVLFVYFEDAVGEALGMADLYTSYIQGLEVLEKENDYVISEQEENGITLKKLYDAGAFEMSGIEEMYVTEEVAQSYFFETTEDDSFFSMPIGEIRFVAHGNKDSMKMAVGEYGENTDLTLQSLINAVQVIHPAGWEEFLDAFTGLREMEGENYKVTFEMDDETKEYLGIGDETDNFSFCMVVFGVN